MIWDSYVHIFLIVRLFERMNLFLECAPNFLKKLLGTIIIIIAITSLSFAQPVNDDFANAVNVSGIINSCSADAAYTNIDATSDKNAASCWNTSPDYNVWFKFVATTANMKVTVKQGGAEGTIQRINTAIWENDGITEVTCKRYVGYHGTEDVTMEAVGTLTIGNTYYISVDNNYASYRGTFTLCLEDNNISYDYYEGAVDVSGLINSCSADAAYSTTEATSDKNAASCWNTSPDYNVWFKFVATTANMKVTVKQGGAEGTIQRINTAIWENDGITEVTCKRYVGYHGIEDVIVEAVGTLTIGNTYYISVDNNYSSYRGTFTLCLEDNNISYDYYEGAVDVSGLINSCSADAAYSTTEATPDKNAASCWNTSPNYNVWFKFIATAANMKVTVKQGGAEGTIQRINTAIWENDGTTEVTCKRYVGYHGTEDVTMEAVGTLTIGNTYYISVDNNYASYRGTFTLCLEDNNISYDFYEGAVDVSGLINSCSADAAYSTTEATPDKNAASCWNTSPNYNVWFKFVATTANMKVTVKQGGAEGTIQRINTAIWENDGTTEVTCKRYVGYHGTEDVTMEAVGTLTIGNTYYISVDNNYSSYRGTFTLCLEDNNISYDYYEGAIEITDINNWCSADAAYSTTEATPDKNAASCWNTSPNYNRWFKFTALTDGISVTVSRGGSKGTLQRANLAIWETDGTTEVACNRYVDYHGTDDVTVEAVWLTPGNVYYISVDNNYSSYRGTFTLCVDDSPSYDFYEGAIELTDLNNWCSGDAAYTTAGATSDKNAASCWNTSPNYNRWFKFTAISPTVDITVDRGGTKGTMQRAQLALWKMMVQLKLLVVDTWTITEQMMLPFHIAH